MSEKAIKFIDKTWKENKLPFPIKEEWAGIMEAYHQYVLKDNKYSR